MCASASKANAKRIHWRRQRISVAPVKTPRRNYSPASSPLSMRKRTKLRPSPRESPKWISPTTTPPPSLSKCNTIPKQARRRPRKQCGKLSVSSYCSRRKAPRSASPSSLTSSVNTFKRISRIARKRPYSIDRSYRFNSVPRFVSPLLRNRHRSTSHSASLCRDRRNHRPLSPSCLPCIARRASSQPVHSCVRTNRHCHSSDRNPLIRDRL